MTPAFVNATNIVSILGMDASSNWNAITHAQSGIHQYSDDRFSKTPFWASMLSATQWEVIKKNGNSLTPFEQLAFYSAKKTLEQTFIVPNNKTAFILSSTKGNIELLGQTEEKKILLSTSAAIIAHQLGITTKPFVVSHACISGVVALMYGLQLIQSGRFEHVIVTGCDRFSKFVLNGFQSFQAIADEPCKPFDAGRKGINLGEAAATIILSAKTEKPLAALLAGSSSNDANHISGPSRTGAELAMAIEKTLQYANISSKEIDIISAHGTATLYNDEMEAKAFASLQLNDKPVHSLKGYIGHTLGTAGIAESVMLIEGIRRQQLIPSMGYSNPGVSVPLNVSIISGTSKIDYALKTASGFGGCNAAIVWKNC